MAELELLNDDELATFLSENHEADFWRSVSKLPTLTARQNRSLLKKYKKYKTECAGKNKIRKRLVEGNIRLIISVAKPYVYRAHSYKFLDLVNEGAAGFIIGIEKFDLSYNTSLSTYVVPWIRQSIGRALKTYDKEVRRPDNFEDLMNRYRKLIEEAIRNGLPIPNDEEVSELLGVTIEVAYLMREDYKLDAVSMDAKVDDSEDTEFSHFLGTSDGGYDKVLDIMVNREIYAYFKMILSPRDYYIFYYHILNQVTLQVLSGELGVTRERIRQISDSILAKASRVLINQNVFYKKVSAVRNYYNMEDFNIYPVVPGAISFFFFIRESLTEEERHLYRLLVFRDENYKKSYYMSKLGVDASRYDELYRSLTYKIKTQSSGVYKEAYNSYKKKFLDEFKAKLYEVPLDGPRPVFYKTTVEHWNSVILSEMESLVGNFAAVPESAGHEIKKGISREVSKLLKDVGDSIPEQTKNLIKKYFTFIYDSPITFEQAEREVNVIMHGYKNETMLPLKTMYEATLKYKNSFPEEQFDYLMTFLFRKMKKSDFASKYPNSTMSNQHYSLILKIERLYLGVARAYSYNFTKEKYVEHRDEYLRARLLDEVALLDLFFGVGCESHSIDEIALIKGVSYAKAHSMVRTSRENCLSFKVSKKVGLAKFDENTYIPILLNDSYDLNERGREMAKLSLIDKKTNKEIADIFGIKPSQVSNTVNDTLRQIDFYRFGIVRNESRFSDNVTKEVLDESNLTDEEKKIVQDSFENKDYKEVARINGVDYHTVKGIIKRFANACYSRVISRVTVLDIDVIQEIIKHPRERVITEEGRYVLAFSKGIKCDCNPEGKKLSYGDISKQMQVDVEKVWSYKRNGIDAIAASKAGIARPTFYYMKISKLQKLLKDPCVPLSQKEKDVLSMFYGLKGHKMKELDEIASMYGMREGSVRILIQRAILSLFKYDAGEIEGIISYEEHILPNLRYFPKSDQAILIALYRDELSYSKIAKQFDLTFDQAVERAFKLKVFILDILNGTSEPFDYDYFEEHVMDDDIPFYGDKELAYRIWWMYFEEKKSVPNIIDELDLNIKRTSVLKDMDTLMCAVLKRKLGIKKCKEFSYEEIRDYYLAHQSEMAATHKVYYYRYFEHKKKKERRRDFRSGSDVSMAITLDLIKESGLGYRSLDDMTREEIIEFIRQYRPAISRGCLAALYCKFRIQGKDFMSGNDQNKVIKALSYLESKPKVLKFKPAGEGNRT